MGVQNIFFELILYFEISVMAIFLVLDELRLSYDLEILHN